MQSPVQLPAIELDGHGRKIGIVVARYNWHITGTMLTLAHEELRRLGVASTDIQMISVPGSFELATAAQALLAGASFDALICFGCVMKGATRHDILVGDAAAQGIQRIALDTGIPIIFGVVCAENEQQASERTVRGTECAQTAIEMAQIVQAARKR
jgi:6,7-dimethyl-8-ribityllumazine synthase